MKAYVITIMSIPESVEIAERCIRSGERFGIKVAKWKATTPHDNPRQTFVDREWPIERFERTTCARPMATMATVLSHYSLWERCVEIGEDVLILEHDAVLVAEIPELENFDGCCQLGVPSFGEFDIPKRGHGPLSSKWYFKGAHGYLIHPHGAERLIRHAKHVRPVDIYLNTKNFPWLTEFYPWPVYCDDSFTTIQVQVGADPHHNKLEILECW